MGESLFSVCFILLFGYPLNLSSCNMMMITNLNDNNVFVFFSLGKISLNDVDKSLQKKKKTYSKTV